jgi:hypothetical protein
MQHSRSRPEPNGGVRTPELCPYRLNNRLDWGYCVHVPSCPASAQHRSPLRDCVAWMAPFFRRQITIQQFLPSSKWLIDATA